MSKAKETLDIEICSVCDGSRFGIECRNYWSCEDVYSVVKQVLEHIIHRCESECPDVGLRDKQVTAGRDLVLDKVRAVLEQVREVTSGS